MAERYVWLLSWVLLPGVWAQDVLDPVTIREVVDKGPLSAVAVQVENSSPSPITISLTWELTNMHAEDVLPQPYVIPAGQVLIVARLRQTEKAKAWNYHYSFQYQWGDARAVHSSRTIYRIPLRPGKRARILQGYHGAFSHTGEDRFSIDWEVSRGTEVRAARDGVVIESFGGFKESGTTEAYRDRANFVRISHADGTVANYLHFKPKGVVVKAGDQVSAGDVIGYSGNTGFSSRPHLHLKIFVPIDGYRTESIPVFFSAKEGEGIELKQSFRYTAK